jgi:AcrR family transcriptional regulator
MSRRAVVRLPRARRVQDILSAARDVFCERGYEDASMAEIAARAGVVEGTIYKYFANKRDLVVKVMEAWYEGMVAGFAADLAGISGTRARLRYLVWRHLRSIREDPALCRVFVREVRAAENYHRSFIHDQNRRYTSFLAAVLREGVAGIEHHVWNFVYGRGALDIEAAADWIADIVLAGLAPAPAARRGESLAGETARLAAVVDRLERVARTRAAPRRT